MKIQCPKCSETFILNGLGRKPLNISDKNVYAALQSHPTKAAAAEYLNCSVGYINSILKRKRGKKKEKKKKKEESLVS